ncbi:MAG TPA: hypothetical protein P5525_07545, partial [Candidatus Paceibacterota bacterium]|nr:hypothetical protein [Candidatus Paceibacterota bacterium]
MRRCSGIGILLAALLARADQPAQNLSLEGLQRFNAAYQAWDARQFAAAAELFRQATTNAPPSSTNFYWLGTAHFHRMLQLQHQPGSGVEAVALDDQPEGVAEHLDGSLAVTLEGAALQ